MSKLVEKVAKAAGRLTGRKWDAMLAQMRREALGE
mgnify:CR=1 FL=1